MAGEPATFRFNGSVFSGASFIWSWGDDTVNTTTSEPQANHIYGNTGEYTITLTVMSTLDLGGDWSVSSEWLQNVGTYSTSVTVNPSDADNVRSSMFTYMYLAVGLVGLILIISALFILMKWSSSGTLVFGGIIILISGIIVILIGLLFISGLERQVANFVLAFA